MISSKTAFSSFFHEVIFHSAGNSSWWLRRSSKVLILSISRNWLADSSCWRFCWSNRWELVAFPLLFFGRDFDKYDGSPGNCDGTASSLRRRRFRSCPEIKMYILVKWYDCNIFIESLNIAQSWYLLKTFARKCACQIFQSNWQSFFSIFGKTTVCWQHKLQILKVCNGSFLSLKKQRRLRVIGF